MHPIGVNTWVWISPLTDATLAYLAARIAGWEFDLLELPAATIKSTQLRENLAPVAEYAGKAGVTVAVEPLNRYETGLHRPALH